MSVTKTAAGTGFIYSEEVVKHFCIWIKEFSERPERTTLPYQRCQELGLIDRCVKIESCTGTKDQARLQHSDDLIQCLIDSAKFDEHQLKILSEKYDSIYFNKFTNVSAWIALGCTVELVDQVLKDEIRNGFALVRPPGHHAMHDEFCGYCYLNNVGVAATHALSKGVERILIVDWDVHHGQATQYSFYEDSRVLYFSIHRYEHGRFWPNLRQSDYDYVGQGAGAGYNINVPLNQMGLGTEDYLAIFNHILMPVAYEFDPQLVLISSGYDAAIGCPEFCPQLVLISSGFDSAYGDPKGEMKVLPAAYAHFIHMLSSLAQGNVCTILEGGYCLTSLAEGVALSLRELLGDPCPNLGPLPPPSDSVTETILNVIKVQRPYWKRLRQQEFLQAPEKCIYDDVNVMPPRAEIVFATEKNRPDRYELELYISPKDEFEKMEDQLKQLKESTKLERPSKRTGVCFEPSMSEFTELYNGSENNQQLAKLFPFLHKTEGVDETSKTLLDDIISGKMRNGVFIPESSNNMANKMSSLITYALDKNNIERLLLLDLSIRPNKERHKIFMNDKRVVYLSIHSHACTEMNKNNEEVDFSVSLSSEVDPEIPVGDEEYFAVFHEIVLPVAYQFGPQLVMLTTSLSDNKSFAVTPKGFSHLIHLLTCLAGGKIFFIVEDGKNIDAKWDDRVASGISALLGRTLEPLKLGKIPDSAIACISAAQKMHRINWECLKFQEKIPQVESTNE